MSNFFRMKLNLTQQAQTQIQAQTQTQVTATDQENKFYPKLQTKNIILSASRIRVCAPLKVTGKKKCSSCGHR